MLLQDNTIIATEPGCHGDLQLPPSFFAATPCTPTYICLFSNCNPPMYIIIIHRKSLAKLLIVAVINSQNIVEYHINQPSLQQVVCLSRNFVQEIHFSPSAKIGDALHYYSTLFIANVSCAK